jgi:hypothetical protein
MKWKSSLATLLLLFICRWGFGQYDTLRVQVFFDLGKASLRVDAQASLQAAVARLDLGRIARIHLDGHTDNVGDPVANQRLAGLRCQAVQDYLVAQGLGDLRLYEVQSHGEDQPIASNATPEGRQFNRSVTVALLARRIVPLPQPAVVVAETAVVAPAVVIAIDPDPNCEQDTTIVLPQGTQLVFNRCEYLKLQPCLTFEEALTRPSVLDNDLTTMDTAGIPLSSCGMVRIVLQEGCAQATCFQHPVKVRTPVPDKSCMTCLSPPTLFAVQARAGWGLPRGEKPEIKVIQVRGKEFYQYELICPGGWMNCDCRTKTRRVKLKIPGGYKFCSATLSFDCPLAVVERKPKPERRQNRLIFHVACPRTDPYYAAVLVTDLGDTMRIATQPLSKLRGHGPHRRCDLKGKRKRIRQFMGFIPIYQHKIYRRYWVLRRPKQ